MCIVLFQHNTYIGLVFCQNFLDGVLDQIKTFINRRNFDERRLRHKVTNTETHESKHKFSSV